MYRNSRPFLRTRARDFGTFGEKNLDVLAYCVKYKKETTSSSRCANRRSNAVNTRWHTVQRARRYGAEKKFLSFERRYEVRRREARHSRRRAYNASACRPRPKVQLLNNGISRDVLQRLSRLRRGAVGQSVTRYNTRVIGALFLSISFLIIARIGA